MVRFDPRNKKTVVPKWLPARTFFGYSCSHYIVPQITDSLPTATLNTEALDDYDMLKVEGGWWLSVSALRVPVARCQVRFER